VAFRSMAGEQKLLQLPQNASVLEAKKILEDEMGIPFLEQRLLHGTAILDDQAKPFLQISQEAAELQVLRQPRMTLEQFRKELGHGETALELNVLLSEAVRMEEPNVALEIVYHPDFADLEFSLKDRGAWLRTLAVSGFATAFEALVEHERVGEIEGVLDEGTDVRKSPKFHAAAAKKGGPPGNATGPGNNTTALHHAANEETETTIQARQPYTGQVLLASVLKFSKILPLRLDSFGRSAVHLLVRSEAMSTVLLKDPLDTMTSELLDLLDMAWGCGAVDLKGRSALHFAATGTVCQLLFAAGFTAVNALDKSNRSALHAARNVGVARAILEHPGFKELNVAWQPGACSTDTMTTALTQFTAISDDAMVLELLKHPRHEAESLQAALEVSRGLKAATKALTFTDSWCVAWRSGEALRSASQPAFGSCSCTDGSLIHLMRKLVEKTPPILP
ncbi:unnamed protein product, partial [Cladocopium goreaui]